MHYYLFREQSGEGCDYTIGCGLDLQKLQASSMKEAIEEVMGCSDDWKEDVLQGCEETGYSVDDYICDYIMDDGQLDGVDPKSERRMATVQILEVANKIDMIPLLQKRLGEIRAWQKELQAQSQEENERRQYEKLKKKFGK